MTSFDPDFKSLLAMAESWARVNGGGGSGLGHVSQVWTNQSLQRPECPARVSFLRGAGRVGLTSWSEGFFAWHGTKSRAAVADICWNNFKTNLRSGQSYGPGEYFCIGGVGLGQSHAASGDARNLLVLTWIIQKAGSPVARHTGFVVCRGAW